MVVKIGRGRISLTYEEVKSYIEDNSNYKLLSDDYVKAKEKLKLECPEGHLCNISYNDFKYGGRRCRICAGKIISDKKRFTYKYVKKIIEEQGYNLLSTEYKGRKEKLLLKCDLGHEFLITLDVFKNMGQRCSICSQKKMGDKLRFSYDYVKEYIENFGYILISREYKNVDTKLEIKCDNNHIYKIAFSGFKKGIRCGKCYFNSIKGENHNNWKGGITPDNIKVRNSENYKIWRNLIFERDLYICQCCKKSGGKLQAHHIENFAIHKNLRFDLNNGITLCKNCHFSNVKGSFHNIYGARNNNRDQLNEYIQIKQKELNLI